MAETNTLVVNEATGLEDRIRLARVAAGLSRRQIAKRLGVSVRTYERIETGLRSAREGEIVALAQITGQDLSFFGASLEDEERGTVSRSGNAVKAGRS